MTAGASLWVPLRAQLIASRHTALVGRPLRSWRVGSGPLPWLLYGAILATIGVLLWVNPHGSTVGNVAILIGMALLLLVIHLVLADGRLVLCERGLIMGRLIPGLPLSPTYVLRADEIDVRSLHVARSPGALSRETGKPAFFFQFVAFPGFVGPPLVTFTGPWGTSATTSRSPHRQAIDARSPYAFGHRRAEAIAQEIAAMAAVAR